MRQFFCESNGQLSNTRLNCTLAAFIAFFMAVMSVVQAFVIDYTIFITLLSYSSGTKLFQKLLEQKTNGNP